MKNLKRKTNNYNRKYALLLAGILLLSGLIVLVCQIAFRNNNEVAKAESLVEQTQAMNGVDKNISFDFLSDIELTNKNFNNYIKVSNMKDEVPACRIKSLGEKKYKLLAPESGYVPGETYSIILYKTRFLNDSISAEQTFYFSIEHEDVVNAVYKDTVREIDENEIIAFNENYIELKSKNYSVGDILIMPFESDISDKLTVKITEIAGQSDIKTTAIIELPDINEVLEEEEIYGTFEPEITESELQNHIKANEESIKEQSMLIPQVRAINEVLNTYAAPNLSIKTKQLIPTIEIKVEGGYNVKKHENDPWKFKLIFTWDLNKKASVKLELNYTQKTKTFISDINEVRNTSTVNQKILGIKLSISGSFEKVFISDLGMKNPIIKTGDYFDNILDENGNVTDPEKLLVEKNYQHKNITQGQKNKEQYILKQNKLISARNDKREVFTQLVNNKIEEFNESDALVKILHLSIPICSSITFSIKIEIYVKIKFTGEFGTLHEISWNDESGTIEYKGETQEYHNESEVKYAGNVYILGVIEFKAGPQIQVYFSFAHLISVGIEFEGGVYAEISGLGSSAWGEYNEDEYSIYDETPYALHAEAGFYIELNAFVRLEFLEWFKGQGKSNGVPIFEYKWKFLDIGHSVISDLTPISANGPSDLLEMYDTDLPVVTIGANGVGELPTFTRLIYDFANGALITEDVNCRDYVVGYSDFIYCSNGYVYEKDSSLQTFEDIVLAYLIVDGKIDENTFLPIKIIKEPKKVETITAYSTSNGIQLDSQIVINSQCEPANASYQQSEFALEYVIKDGVKISVNLGDYAELSASGLLYATDKLSLGDRIGVKAHAIYDDVWSEPYEVEVIKTEVADVRIIAEDYARSIGAGEKIQIYPRIYPLNASFPECEVYITTGKDLCRLIVENGEYFVVCNDNVEIGQTIGITASSDGGNILSDEYLFTVGIVPVERIDIEDEFGNKFLERKENINKIQQGNSVKLQAVYSPYNATVVKSEFYLTDGATYATIDEQGNFSVNQFAPVGAIITVIATADGVNSSEYTFEVVKVPVKKIELKNYQCAETVKPGETIQFYPVITPNNATYISPVYTIVEGMDFATVSAYGTLIVAPNAEVGREIRIIASTDGVESDEFVLTIIPIFAENLQLFAVKDTLKPGEDLQINCVVGPNTATHAQEVEYKIIEGEQYATVNDYGYLHINKEIDRGDAVVKVQAVLDGVYSNVLVFKIYVPVEKVEIVFNSGAVNEMRVYMSEKFSVNVYPAYASNASDIQYLATNNDDFVTLSESFNGCYLTVKENAIIGDRFSVAAIVDGIQSPDYFITVVKTPVEWISNNCDSNLNIGEGKAHTLNATAYPLNASYRSVSYRIKDGFDIADIIMVGENKFKLQVQEGSDKIGRTIKVIASADGVDGEPIIYTVIKNSVEYVNISDCNDLTELKPGESTTIAYEVNADASFTNAVYKITAGNDYASISMDGILAVNDYISVSDAKVSVVAIVDGIESNELVYDLFVPVSEVNITSDRSNTLTGSIFNVYANVNNNSTNKHIELNVVSGAEYIEAVSVDDSGHGSYKVKEDVNIPNAEVTFVAVAQGISSNELTINIVVPVTEVVVYSNNLKPMQGGIVYVNSVVYPNYATNKTVTYRLKNNINGVMVNPATGEVNVQYFVEVGSEFAVIASAEGVDSAPIYFRVQKLPVAEVVLSEINKLTEVCVGESINLSAQVLPVEATYTNIKWTVLENGAGIVINNNGRVDVSPTALVGAVVKIKATVDGIDSNIYEVTLLKQPVKEVSLDFDSGNSYGENRFIAGSMVKLFASVNDDATFSDISFVFLDYKYLEFYALGAKIGSVQEFVFKIKDEIDVPNASVTFFAVADGVRSRQITLSIYNPVKDLKISLIEEGQYTAERSVSVNVRVNGGKNNSTVQPVLTVVQGIEYLNEISFGQYKIKSAEELELWFKALPDRDRTIKIKASADGVESNIVEFEIYIPVLSVEFIEIPKTITIASANNSIKAKVFPEYATDLSVTYSIVNQRELPFVTINSLNGEITVSNNKAYIGKNIVVKVIAADGIFNVQEIGITKIALEQLAISEDTAREVLPGAQISLYSVPTPGNATFADNLRDVKYYIKSGSAYINGNILTVRSTSLVGSQIVIYAQADGIQSQEFIVNIVSAPETAVRLYTDNDVDFDKVRGGQQIQFDVDVQLTKPDSEADFPVIFKVEGPATISASGLLKVDARPKNNSIIKVIAETVGVTKVLTLTVKTPIVLIQNLYVINEAESTYLTLNDSDLFEYVNFYLDSDSADLATINMQSGLLTVNSGVKGNSKIKAYAIADGERSNVVELTIFVEVKNLTFSTSSSMIYSYTTQELMGKNTTDEIGLQTMFNKDLSSNTNVRYRLIAGGSFVQNAVVENGTYYVKDNYIQAKTNIGSRGNSIELCAEVYGAYGQTVTSANTETINIYIPVESISLTRDSLGTASGNNYVQQSMSYNFSAAVYPAFADNTSINFSADSNYCNLAQNGNKVTLSINGDAKLNGAFDLTAFAADGIESKYNLCVEEVCASEISYSIRSEKNNNVLAVLSKVYAGDILTFDFEYRPMNVSETYKNAQISFSSTSVSTVNNYAHIVGNKIYINSVDKLFVNEPEFQVYVWATKKNGAKTNVVGTTINIYIPVVDVNVGLKEVNRGSTTNLQVIYNSVNGGYANPAAKSNSKSNINVSGNSSYASYISFNGDSIIVPKYFNTSNVITGRITTPDGAYSDFRISIKALSLNANNVFYNNADKMYSDVSYDSEGRTMYSDDNAQLEENCYTYVLGKYNRELISSYGVSLSVSKATDSISYNYLQIIGNQVRISQDAPGDNTATLYVKFQDGDVYTTITKKIGIFNAVNDVTLKNSTVTARETQLSAAYNDSKASVSSISYSFGVLSNTDYSLASNGEFTVKNKSVNGSTIYITVNTSQSYNNSYVERSYSNKPLNIEIPISEDLTFHAEGDVSTITDDKTYYDDSKSTAVINLSTLKSLGYTQITFTISVKVCEIDRGYQEIYFDIYKNGAYKQIQKYEFEHGGSGSPNKEWGMHNFIYKMSIDDLFNNYGSTLTIRLGYSASGKLGDDWNRGYSNVNILAS